MNYSQETEENSNISWNINQFILQLINYIIKQILWTVHPASLS